jgi:hypothetical protein
MFKVGDRIVVKNIEENDPIYCDKSGKIAKVYINFVGVILDEFPNMMLHSIVEVLEFEKVYNSPLYEALKEENDNTN